MSISPSYTRQNILDQIAKINCCSANFAFTITDDAQKGVETCECEIEELSYLNDSRETLNNYYPTGAIVRDSVPNAALVTIPTNYTQISGAILQINGVTVYTQPAGTETDIGTVLGNIVTAGIATYTLTHPLTLTLMLIAPLTIYSGISVSLTFAYNNGSQWVAVNNGLTTLDVRALIVNGPNIFAGTNGGGVFKSTNNGTSWVAVNSGGVSNAPVISFTINPSGVFAGTSSGNGAFFSTNNGTSWAAINTGLTNLTILSLTYNGLNVFAGTNGGGIFKTINNGTTWTAVNTGLANLTVFCLTVDGGDVYAGTNGGGVFKSTNQGVSWAAVNTGITDLIVLSLTIKSGVIYAGTDSGGVFKTANQGTSWAAVNTGLTNLGILSFGVSGANLFAGTYGGGVFLSTNSGTSWTEINTGLTGLFIRAFTTSGSNVFAGANGAYLLNNGTTGNFAQTFTFGGGAYMMTDALQCLTTLQVDSIIENTTQLCGCATCTQNEDTTPQANAIIINNVVSGTSVVNITSANFTGNNYQNNLIIGKIPGTDFDVFTYPATGLGLLLHVNDGFTYDVAYPNPSLTGTITLPPGDYKIIFYNA